MRFKNRVTQNADYMVRRLPRDQTAALQLPFEYAIERSAAGPSNIRSDNTGEADSRKKQLGGHVPVVVAVLPNHIDSVSGVPKLASLAVLQPTAHNAKSVMSTSDNLNFMRRLDTGSMKLIVTSPPYNIRKAYERKRSSLEEYVDVQAQVIAESVRLLHPAGSICWQVGNHVDDGEIFPLDLMLYGVFKEHNLKLRNRIVWHFEHGLHGTKRLSGRYETILWFTKSDLYTFNLDPIRVPAKYPNKKHYKGPRAGQLSCNPLGKNPGDVWIIPNVKCNHVEKTIHPCQFPVELIERLVLMLTEEGDKVLDPYMGVGSAVLAAVKNGREGYGCDTVSAYVKIATDRLNELRAGRLRTRPINRPVYDPSKPYGGQK